MNSYCKNILLTGATGFLGAHLLNELMRKTDATIYCLVRTPQQDSSEDRLMRNLAYLFGEEQIVQWNTKRIIPVLGDVGQDNLGLSVELYNMLSETVDTIFHSAAMMWHFGQLDQFSEVNVKGVRRLLSFAEKGISKRLNHISTLAVSGRRCDNPENLFTENDFHENMECPNAYVQTKYEAERILLPALNQKKGIRIFRPGFIMGDSLTGKFKEHITMDAQYLHLRGHILMETAPPLYDDDFMDITPADYAADAITHIALTPETENSVFHICNPQPILKSEIWECVRNWGYPIRTLPAETYMEEVLTLDESEAFLEGLKDIIVYLSDYEKSPAVFKCSNTLKALEGTEIHCPPPDKELLQKYLAYCVKTNFIPAPSSNTGGERA
ncbi:thioester reductase domain-containing protein [Halodesulfovibrio aestuarii]|uniref:Thioester reductase domain-containing protein n=1 Tax=Halodesulfovibrio aestuarii TaxID=126333 RepID=A0A8G2CBG6_9BACT|nr:thioester reductase domain-containing protein [Halodesulfovibrio aestuarii]SHJ55827.1 thioester reductase domain-containing protein [Halodesulfovibrio aestuarii]